MLTDKKKSEVPEVQIEELFLNPEEMAGEADAIAEEEILVRMVGGAS